MGSTVPTPSLPIPMEMVFLTMWNSRVMATSRFDLLDLLQPTILFGLRIHGVRIPMEMASWMVKRLLSTTRIP